MLSQELLTSIDDNSFNIFLCGESIEQDDTIREKIHSRISRVKNYNIIFPEWIFPDLLAHKKKNILSLEAELAEYVDLIVLPLVSVATYTELGAFASNESLARKIIILNEKKYKERRSFINLGPIRTIQNYEKENVVWYDDVDDAVERVVDLVAKTYRRRSRPVSEVNPKNWFASANLILAIVTLYQEVDRREILVRMKKVFGSVPENVFLPSVRILMKRKLIKERYVFDTKRKVKNTLYSLSDEGYKHLFLDPGESFRPNEMSKRRLDVLVNKSKNRLTKNILQRDLENFYEV